jgi:Flp pilus assembly protein TadD
VNKVTEPYLGLAEAHFARAQAAHVASDDALARTELDRALALRPEWEQAALVRAQLTGDSAEAAKFLGQFVAANPKASEARLGYARGLVAEKRYGEARQEFQRLLAEKGGSGEMVYAVAVLSLQLNDFDEAEKQLKHLVETNHAEINNARVYLGQIAEERKRWDEALQWYGQVTAGNQYMAARMRMAQVLVRQAKLPEARRVLQESAAANLAERSQLLIAEAQLLRDAGQPRDSYAVLAEGLAQHPDQPELLYETAMMAERTGSLPVAERHLRRLIEIKPDYAHAYNALGYSLAERNERLDEAQQLIDKALQLAPEDPFILDSKGWVLFRRGDASGALEALKRAFALRADPEIAAHMGEVLWALGRKDEARKTWSEAEKAHPGNEVLLGTIKKFTP